MNRRNDPRVVWNIKSEEKYNYRFMGNEFVRFSAAMLSTWGSCRVRLVRLLSVAAAVSLFFQRRLLTYAVFLPLFLAVLSCVDIRKEKDMDEKYSWEEGKSCPLGYPIEVYRGGFSNVNGDFVSLYSGITAGTRNWGDGGNGMSHEAKLLPDRLYVQWLSYAEDAIFEVDAALDKEKIASYFRKGIQRRRAEGNLCHEEYTRILAGFAPGAVVVVWVAGPGVQQEIGRYQGYKIEIPQSEIQALDYPDKVLFDSTYRPKVMKDPGIVPLAVQQANAGKAIPYGLWDLYRRRYALKVVFKLQNKAILGDCIILHVNGERNRYFQEWSLQDEKDPEVFYYKVDQDGGYAIPREIIFNWKAKDGRRYHGDFEFLESEIQDAFTAICEQDKDVKLELQVRVNLSNSYASILLQGSNGKEVWLHRHEEATFFKLKD
ncbi:DUF2931 family protein [Sphingobacterium sp. Mn56C]|uniref:DUF2931 family protein n=1 Tax=Sphingobacterium sp. Mn56C TaxID=3395261 RepID=UPI003BD31F28